MSRKRRSHHGPSDDRVPTLSDLLLPMVNAWRLDLDPEAACRLALSVLQLLRAGIVNFERDYAAVSQAAEILWDTDHCGQASELVRLWRRGLQEHLAEGGPHSDTSVLIHRVRAVRLSARVAYRVPDLSAAWAYVRAGYFLLREAVGGEEALTQAIVDDPHSGVAEIYIELLGIGVPVAAKMPPTIAATYKTTFLRDAEVACRILSREGTATTAHHALVSQTLLTIVRMGKPWRDTELVQLLWKLEIATRPKDARGQVTRPALWAEVAEYFGNDPGSRKYRKLAQDELLAVGMVRRWRRFSGG